MSGVQFTALVRLPFARGNFIDPQQASWDASKDRILWRLISKSSKTTDLNWTEIADNFHVPTAFLLQQAAWLYERHLEHVRAQMKKVGGLTAQTSVNLDSTQTAAGGETMKRGGSAGSAPSRAPSALAARPRESPVSRGEVITPAPPLSRTPSTHTITQSRAYTQQLSARKKPARNRQKPTSGWAAPPTSKVASPGERRSSVDIGQQRGSVDVGQRRGSVDVDSPEPPASSSESSSSSGSEVENPAMRSQLFKKPPRFRAQRPRELVSFNEDPDEADEQVPSRDASLPFANAAAPSKINSGARYARTAIPSSNSRQRQDEGLRGAKSFRPGSKPERVPSGTETASSMTSSASDAPRIGPRSPDPLSPNHRADLAKLSPRGAKSRREGSEGTPSMGSSFSDLDDTSISQSALEEALLSNIQHGRMSTLSQLRSRYL